MTSLEFDSRKTEPSQEVRLLFVVAIALAAAMGLLFGLIVLARAMANG